MAPTYALVLSRRGVFRCSSLRPQHVRLHSRVSMVCCCPRLDHRRGACDVCNDCGWHLSRSGKVIARRSSKQRSRHAPKGSSGLLCRRERSTPGSKVEHHARSQAQRGRRPQPSLRSSREVDGHREDTAGDPGSKDDEGPTTTHCPKPAALTLQDRPYHEWGKRELRAAERENKRDKRAGPGADR